MSVGLLDQSVGHKVQLFSYMSVLLLLLHIVLLLLSFVMKSRDSSRKDDGVLPLTTSNKVICPACLFSELSVCAKSCLNCLFVSRVILIVCLFHELSKPVVPKLFSMEPFYTASKIMEPSLP